MPTPMKTEPCVAQHEHAGEPGEQAGQAEQQDAGVGHRHADRRAASSLLPTA